MGDLQGQSRISKLQSPIFNVCKTVDNHQSTAAQVALETTITYNRLAWPGREISNLPHHGISDVEKALEQHSQTEYSESKSSRTSDIEV